MPFSVEAFGIVSPRMFLGNAVVPSKGITMQQESNHRLVSDILARRILKPDGRVMSPAAAYHRRDSLLHRFVPIGGGLVVPVGLNSEPCGYRPGQTDVHSVPHLAIREELLNRSFLLMNEFMFVDRHELFQRSPESRRVYSVRSYLVLRRLGFPRPQMPSGSFIRIRSRLEDEAEMGACK